LIIFSEVRRLSPKCSCPLPTKSSNSGQSSLLACNDNPCRRVRCLGVFLQIDSVKLHKSKAAYLCRMPLSCGQLSAKIMLLLCKMVESTFSIIYSSTCHCTALCNKVPTAESRHTAVRQACSCALQLTGNCLYNYTGCFCYHFRCNSDVTPLLISEHNYFTNFPQISYSGSM
jgi:hypothetical protein